MTHNTIQYHIIPYNHFIWIRLQIGQDPSVGDIQVKECFASSNKKISIIMFKLKFYITEDLEIIFNFS